MPSGTPFSLQERRLTAACFAGRTAACYAFCNLESLTLARTAEDATGTTPFTRGVFAYAVRSIGEES